MVSAIDSLSIFLLMLVTGLFWGPWFALTRSLNVFNADEFIKITKTLSANLGKPMRFMLPSCIIVMTLAVYFYPEKDTPGFYLAIAAVILILLSLIVTVIIEVPIVKKIEQWDASTLPANWAAYRERWIKFHILRVISSLAGFACLALAISR